MLISVMILSFTMMTACSDVEETSGGTGTLDNELETGKSDFDDPAYLNEDDGAEPLTVTHEEADFYGNWEGTSERVAYLFGNVNLSIREDGTWKGNVTETDLKGKWKYDGKQIIIKDTEGLVYWRLYYTSDGNLLFEDLEDQGYSFVLKKGPAVK